jgi:hypothetical protein
MITVTAHTKFSKTKRFLEKARELVRLGNLDEYGKMGVEALRAATPVDTGETAASWYYKIEHDKTTDRIIWGNSHVVDGVPIAVIIQYGHATRSGSWVEGIDYINPAMQPVFEQIAADIQKEVKRL